MFIDLSVLVEFVKQISLFFTVLLSEQRQLILQVNNFIAFGFHIKFMLLVLVLQQFTEHFDFLLQFCDLLLVFPLVSANKFFLLLLILLHKLLQILQLVAHCAVHHTIFAFGFL